LSAGDIDSGAIKHSAFCREVIFHVNNDDGSLCRIDGNGFWFGV